VKFHRGEIRVRSVEGRGTTFTVSIPPGAAHLSASRIAHTPAGVAAVIGATPYVEEALRCLPGRVPDGTGRIGPPRANSGGQPAACIVVADNTDMRDYVGRLLAESFEVITAAGGEAALAAARQHRPDLVLAGVMMPVMDGYSLLEHLRADPQTARIPIVLLSARAGEEARVEGLEQGADDYLIKPFSARELLARIRTHVDLAHARQAAESVLLKSKQQLGSRVREREALLREIHHRVKNNLQVISSLLEMQARRADDPVTFSQLQEACNRVISIASIHQMLYQRGSLAEVDLSDYARDLAERLVNFYGEKKRVRVMVTGDGSTLELNRAVPCGLLLNELVSASGRLNARQLSCEIDVHQHQIRVFLLYQVYCSFPRLH
jgi:DNA-binding response OmpR family regulator